MKSVSFQGSGKQKRPSNVWKVLYGAGEETLRLSRPRRGLGRALLSTIITFDEAES